MTEKLKGHFVYGEPYPDPIKGTSVSFEVEWTLIDGIINGICVDDEGKKVFDTPASIRGFIDDNTISFIKKYPKYFEIDETGNTRISDELPAPEIHYYGLIIDNHFEGDWTITTEYVLENGEIEYYDCTGTWTLFKQQLES
jgi:hypothetical protein